MGRSRWVLIVAIACPALGCALLSGLSDLDVGNGADASTSDAAVDVKLPDAATLDGAPTACGCDAGIPSGFVPYLFPKSGNGGGFSSCPPTLARDTVYLDALTSTASGPCSCTCVMSGCSNPVVTFWDGTFCSGSLGTLNLNGGCQALPQNLSATSAIKTTTTTGPGCTTVSSFPAAYSGTARLCAPQGSDCTNFCNAATQGLPLCYVAPGDVACPAGLTKTLVSGAPTDTRTCTGCTCSTSASACNVTLTYHGNAVCTQADGGLTQVTDNCTMVPTVSGSYVRGNVTVGGTCTATGGTASGSVAPANVRTVCCK